MLGAEGYGFWYNPVFKKFPSQPHGDSIAYQLVPSVDRFDHAKELHFPDWTNSDFAEARGEIVGEARY